MSNSTRGVVERQSRYDLGLRHQGKYSSTPANFSSNCLLAAVEAEMLVIPAPSGAGSWGVRLEFRRIPGGLEKRFTDLKRAAEAWGLPGHSRESIHPVERVWMER